MFLSHFRIFTVHSHITYVSNSVCLFHLHWT